MIHVPYTVCGIVFAILGNFLISLSLNIQKQAHQVLDSDTQSYLHSWRWWTGFLLMTLGEVGNFVAYGLAPVSIVTPLGVVTIISNSTFVAPVLFKEQIRTRDIAGTFIAALGVVLMVLSTLNGSGSAPQIDNPFSYVDSIVMSRNTIAYLAVTLVVSFVLVTRVHGQDYNLDRNFYLISHLTVVALFGAYTAMATKLLSSIVEFASWLSVLANFRSYTLLCIIIVTSALQIRYLNDCLRVASATTVVPLHFVFFTLSVLVASTITFHDFQNKSGAQFGNFCIGCGLTFLGVFCICGDKPEEGDMSEEPLLPEMHLEEPLSAVSSIVSTEDVAYQSESTSSYRPLQSSKSVPDLHERPGKSRAVSQNSIRRNSLSQLTAPKTRQQSLGSSYFLMSGAGGVLMNTMLSSIALQPTTENANATGDIV